MKELNEKWGEQLLAFAAELPGGYSRFPKHLLNLICKHFKLDKLLFFPYTDADGDGEFPGQHEALHNFSALNLDLRGMREYALKYFRDDMFFNLPESLLCHKVVLLEDIIPWSEFEKTEYYRYYFARCNFRHQACIFLKHKERNVAAVNIYRSQQEEPFSAGERMLFSFLSDLISTHYAAAFNNSINLVIQNIFNPLFSNLNVGAALLNQRLIVLKANPLAHKYSKLILDSANKRGDVYQRGVYSKDESNHNVQQVINRIGLELDGDGSTFAQTWMVENFVFYHNSFLSANFYGNPETWHLIFIGHKRRPASQIIRDDYEKLTQRETEILDYVTHGHSNEKICDLLHVSIFTVRTHIANIYKKFGVNSKVELLLKINQKGGNIPIDHTAG